MVCLSYRVVFWLIYKTSRCFLRSQSPSRSFNWLIPRAIPVPKRVKFVNMDKAKIAAGVAFDFLRANISKTLEEKQFLIYHTQVSYEHKQWRDYIVLSNKVLILHFFFIECAWKSSLLSLPTRGVDISLDYLNMSFSRARRRGSSLKRQVL